ncbi:HSP70-domain-containing protein [Coprinellus micaceus]|uniref:HSP70-domain-containing protein n=1 Tax=Coprinellus micaceus TaxID=71717 RepID=A0A4Y7TK38_COPMI|nr:HSP70-domain-containing protein [Coprinellus micaceus]
MGPTSGRTRTWATKPSATDEQLRYNVKAHRTPRGVALLFDGSQNDRVEIIANDQFSSSQDKRLIGDTAKNQTATNPNTYGIRRQHLIGRKSGGAEVQSDTKHFPLHFFDKALHPLNLHGPPQDEGTDVVPQTTVNNAVVIVIAYFNDFQRQATEDVGIISDMNVLLIIEEPAAVACGLDKKAQGQRNVLVFDPGGGTFHDFLLAIEGGILEVKATAGDTHLVGEGFDNCLVNHFIQEPLPKPCCHLRSACERVKRILSSVAQTSIEIDPPKLTLSTREDRFLHLICVRFEELCQDFFRPPSSPSRRPSVTPRSTRPTPTRSSSVAPPVSPVFLSEFSNAKEPKEPKKLNNPAVACGAASLPSLAIEAASGVITALVNVNATVHTKNNHLGVLIQVEVAFEINASGIPNVSAHDKTTAKSDRTTITNDKGQPSKEEIDCMVSAAENNKAEAEATAACKNGLGSYTDDLHNSTNDDRLADKFEAGIAKKLRSAIDGATLWLDNLPETSRDDRLAPHHEYPFHSLSL